MKPISGKGGGRHRAAMDVVRLQGLDGLRAIAVAAVFAFHADFGWARGGYLGVDVFFVVSGFLITSLLADEFDREWTIRLGSFYWRRLRRLLPAVLLLMAVVTLVARALAPDALERLHDDAIASLFYVTNWELLAVDVPYFESMGRPPLLQHLWSLAIEEQFYIVWAPLALFALPRFGRRGLAVLALLLAAASAAWMAHMAGALGWPDSGRDPTRLYFGTDTHGFGLFIGAALGLLWQPNDRPRDLPRSRIGNIGAYALGIALLAALALQMSRLGEQTAWLYPWGLLLASLTAAALVCVATWRGSLFGRVLDMPPLRFIGERSYGIYLWHWPVFMLTRPDLDLHLDAGTILAIRVAATLALALASYRFVEWPIRRAGTARVSPAFVFAALAALLVGVPEPLDAQPDGLDQAVAMVEAPTAIEAPDVAIDSMLEPALALAVQDIVAVDPAGAPAFRHVDGPVAPLDEAAVGVDTAPASLPSPSSPPPSPAPRAIEVAGDTGPYVGAQLTALGDSVLLGSAPLLRATLTGAQVYATTGWQAADVLAQLKTLAEARRLTPVVLIHLGTNGYVTEGQLHAMLSMLADRRRVILVNTHVPRRWMDANNELIDRAIRNHPNVVLANWRDVAAGHAEYFIADGVHPNEIGQVALIGEMMRAGHLVSNVRAQAGDAVIHAPPPGDLAATLVRNVQHAAPEVWWRRLALCETGADWHRDGIYGGGFGLTAQTWATWGGLQFAATPAAATQQEQIAIANRIATEGWRSEDGFVRPIGFSGWRCAAVIARPIAAGGAVFTRESVIEQTFALGERGDVVRDLQFLLGLPRDGLYSQRLRSRHLAWLAAHHLPLERAGAAVSSTPLVN